MKKILGALKRTAAAIGKFTGITWAIGRINALGQFVMDWTALVMGHQPQPQQEGPEVLDEEAAQGDNQAIDLKKDIGRDPHLVMAYAQSQDALERLRLSRSMTGRTREWTTNLSSEQLYAIERSGLDALKAHMQGERAIDGLPKRDPAPFGVGNRGKNVTAFGKRPSVPTDPAPASKAIAAMEGKAHGRFAQYGGGQQVGQQTDRESRAAAWEQSRAARMQAAGTRYGQPEEYRPKVAANR